MKALLLSVALLANRPESQQTCPAVYPDPAYGFSVGSSCDGCIAGQPVTFTVGPPTNICPYQYGCPQRYTVQACDTLTWDFGDGTPQATITGSPTVSHTYAARGGYHASVVITNSAAPTNRPKKFDVVVGSNPPTVLNVNVPVAYENDPALVITLTRTGDLSAPTNLTYDLVPRESYTPRLTAASGTVAFVAGESQKTLSFPLSANDSVFTGVSKYDFEVTCSDGTLITGLQPSAYTPFDRQGSFVILDDEPRPHLRLDDVAVVEGTGVGPTTALVTATLDAPLGYSFGVTISSANETALWKEDFINQETSVAFSPGQTVATGVFQIVADADPEPDETFRIFFSAYDNPNNPIFEREARVTILNDDVGFGQRELRLFVGESATLPIDIGNPLRFNDTLRFTPADPAILTAVPTIAVGSPTGEVKITGLRGGDTTLVGTVTMSNGRVATGQLHVLVFQPSILVSTPDAVRLHTGEETVLHVSFFPAQPQSQPVIVNSLSDGIVSVLTPLVDAPAGGESVIKLRAIGVGNTTLIVWSPGQQKSTIVPVEVIPAAGRRRAAR